MQVVFFSNITIADQLVGRRKCLPVVMSQNGTVQVQSYNQLPMDVTCYIGISSPTIQYTNSTPLNVICKLYGDFS